MSKRIDIVDVVHVEALDTSHLFLRFSNGKEGLFDMSALIADGGPMAEPLKDPDYFDRVFVEMGAPTWPNSYDMDPIALYNRMEAEGVLKKAVELLDN